MPWNAHAGAGRLGPGIPKSDFWATAKERIDQVGCVYTAQGFEFDYVGVIFGPDLVYRPMDGGSVGQRHESRDRIVSRGVTDAEQHERVGKAGRRLVELRDGELNPTGLTGPELDKRTLTNLYNQRPTWLDHAHAALDTTVFAAYGWPPEVDGTEVLERLLALNLERTAAVRVLVSDHRKGTR